MRHNAELHSAAQYISPACFIASSGCLFNRIHQPEHLPFLAKPLLWRSVNSCVSALWDVRHKVCE